jgi:hypothetical protein
MWPLNFITGRIYELSHGYMKKGGSHIISPQAWALGPRIKLGEDRGGYCRYKFYGSDRLSITEIVIFSRAIPLNPLTKHSDLL